MSPPALLSTNELYSKLLEVIKQEGNNNKEDIKSEIKRETRKLSEEINAKIKEENRKLTELIEQQNQKIILLQSKCDQFQNRCLNLERQIRKNNIIIFGLTIENDISLLEFVINKLNTLLGIELKESDISNLFIIKTNKGEPVKIEFTSYLKKNLIFKNIGKLKGTKIFIANDLCVEDRSAQKILLQHLKHARSKNYYAYIKGQTLIINGEVYTPEQLQSKNLEEAKSETPNQILSIANIPRKVNSAPSTPKPDTDEVFEFEENLLDTARTLESPPLPPAKKKKTFERTDSTGSSGSHTEQRKTRAKSVAGKSAVAINK